MEIANGIHWIEGTQGCNVYLLTNGQQCCLVDAGFLGAFGYVAAYIRYLGLPPRALTHILLTHNHLAHAAAARPIQAWSGAIITAAPPRMRSTALVPPVDVPLHAGAALPLPAGFRGEAIASPGHSPDSLSFWLPDRRVLFVGDVVIGDRGQLRRPYIRVDQASVNNEAVRCLAALPAAIVLPGHGAPILQEGQAALAEALDAPPLTLRTSSLLHSRHLVVARIRDLLFGSRSVS